jgi:predicted nuclease of predicted toxin-antitoxin system
MKLWLDAQLPPQLAAWIKREFQFEATALRELGLRDASDKVIFDAAKKANVVLMSKDADFVELVLREGVPPHLIWLTCGNLSNHALQILLSDQLPKAKMVLENGESIVEIN